MAEARSGSSPHRGSTPSSAEEALLEAVQATSSGRPYRAPGVRRGTSGDRRSTAAPLGRSWPIEPTNGKDNVKPILHFLCGLNWLKKGFDDAIAYFRQDLRGTSIRLLSKRRSCATCSLVRVL